MGAALGWFGMIAQGFQPSPKILSYRPHDDVGVGVAASASAARRSHPFVWSLDAKKRDVDEERSPLTVVSRRSAFTTAAAILTAAAVLSSSFGVSPAFAKPGPNGLILSTAPDSGLRWADAKVGSGEIPSAGSITSIDYSMASTAGRFPSIYSTKNGDEPYRWKLGDGSTIKGIEMAILGDPSEGIPPMRPGGIRRVIVPNALGYNALIGRDKNNNMILNSNSNNNNNDSPTAKNQRCMAGSEGSLGPIPPKEAPDGAYQRWYQFYCNPRIPYQPDLVLDIKLYGKRGTTMARASVISE
jgi:FKBP-type peptidyl-prolyl cis-trans isomerase